MLSVWKSLRRRWWVIFQVFRLNIKSCAASFPSPCFSWPGPSHTVPPVWRNRGLWEFPAHRWHPPRELQRGHEWHKGRLNFLLFTQEGKKKPRSWVCCSFTDATSVLSSTSHCWSLVLSGRCPAPKSRQHFKTSCPTAVHSGLVLTGRENRIDPHHTPLSPDYARRLETPSQDTELLLPWLGLRLGILVSQERELRVWLSCWDKCQALTSPWEWTFLQG